MPKVKQQSDNAYKMLVLGDADAIAICKRHGYAKAARLIVNALPYLDRLKPPEVGKLVEDQILMFARSLVGSVERATLIADKVEQLPKRADQGTALREIRGALEKLRNSIERNWKLVMPLIDIGTAEQLSGLLTTAATEKLLPIDLRSEYVKISADTEEYNLQNLKRSDLLLAGSRPLTRLIKGAKIAVRHAEKSRVSSGAPLKSSLEIALMIQLAAHYEWALEKKASWTDNGPFSKFSADVFAELEFESDYSWEHLLREALNLHRRSFFTRRRHLKPSDVESDETPPSVRMPRKKWLVPKSRKTK